MKHHNPLIIVKYGSKCLIDNDGLDQGRIDEYAKKLISLRRQYDLVIVSSGAVAVGKKRWLSASRTGAVDAQVLASVGSAGITEAWQQAFQQHGVMTGQVLVTHHEIEDVKEGSSLTTSMINNLTHDVISIVNENDVLSSDELKKLAYGGDNDGLAAHLAIRLKAKALLILSSVDGFLVEREIQPRVRVAEIDQLRQHFYEANEEGTGSMDSKLRAAALVAQAGGDAFIGNAGADYGRILAGENGTQVVE